MDDPKVEFRRAAAEAGKTRYHGTPCRRCGASERYTTNGACIACAVMREGLRRMAIRALIAEGNRGTN